MATKRITRQEMRADPIADSAHRAQTAIVSHWRTAITVVLILLTAIVGFTLFSRSRAAAERDAHRYWMRAQDNLIDGDHAAALELVGQLESRHAGTPSGKKGVLIRGHALLGLGRYDEARNTLEEASRVLAKDPILLTSARRGLAVAAENAGDVAGAAPIYETLAGEAVPEGGRLFDLRSAARCYREIGDLDRAERLLRRVVDDHGDATDPVIASAVNHARVTLAELAYARRASAVAPASGGGAVDAPGGDAP